MATKKTDDRIIALEPIKVKYATIFIDGDGDLVLNKMNARNERTLNDRDDKKSQGGP